MAETLPPVPASRRSGPVGVLLVFLLGMVCGGALLFALGPLLARRMGPGGPGPDPGPGPGGGPPLRMLTRELDLDEAQREQIRAIFERTRGDVRRVVEGSREEIRAVLRPDQRERFDRLRPPRPLFGRGRGRHGGPDGPPSPPPE